MNQKMKKLMKQGVLCTTDCGESVPKKDSGCYGDICNEQYVQDDDFLCGECT